MVRQISRDEWLRQFRSREVPMPRNIPGLPPADATIYAPRPSQEELDYIASFHGQPSAAPQERPLEVRQGDRVVYKRIGDTSIESLPRGTYAERAALDRAMAQREIEREVQRQAAREALESIDPNSPFAAAAGGLTAQSVISEAIGRPVSESIANRAKSYVEILNLTPAQGVKLAELEAASGDSRAASRALPQSWVQKIAATGELTPDPAARGLLRAAIEGVIDESTPVAAQIGALDPYVQAAVTVAQRSGEPYRELSPEENAAIASQTGFGRKLRSGRRNPNDKNVSERVDTPYLVPALLAKATEPTWSKGPNGEWVQTGVQPPTIAVAQARGPGGYPVKQRVYDAGAVELGLLDPSALLPTDLGYLRFTSPEKETSGGYGPTTNVATLQGDGREVYGFAPVDDPAAVRESVPMTLGQAVRDILYRHSVPLVDLRDEDVVQGPGGQLLHRQSGKPVYPLKNQQFPGAATTAYRIGEDRKYGLGAYQEFGDLIERLTGQRLVVNQRLQDPGLSQMQREALMRSLPEDWIRTQEGGNPTYDLMQALARGSSLRPGDLTGSPVVMGGPEAEFYLNAEQGPRFAQRLQDLRTAALAAQEQAGLAPRAGSAAGGRPMAANIPAVTPELLARLPEAARANVESGLAAPEGSPRRRAVDDFLARWMQRQGS